MVRVTPQSAAQLLVAVGLLSGGTDIALPVHKQSTESLHEQLDAAVRRLVSDVVQIQAPAPAERPEEPTRLQWRYASGTVTLRYWRELSAPAAAETLRLRRAMLSVGSRMLPPGTIGDAAFVLQPTGRQLHVYFTRGLSVVQVSAPHHGRVLCKLEYPPAPCSSASLVAPSVPPHLTVAFAELSMMGFDPAISFAAVFDDVFEGWK